MSDIEAYLLTRFQRTPVRALDQDAPAVAAIPAVRRPQPTIVVESGDLDRGQLRCIRAVDEQHEQQAADRDRRRTVVANRDLVAHGRSSVDATGLRPLLHRAAHAQISFGENHRIDGWRHGEEHRQQDEGGRKRCDGRLVATEAGRTPKRLGGTPSPIHHRSRAVGMGPQLPLRLAVLRTRLERLAATRQRTTMYTRTGPCPHAPDPCAPGRLGLPSCPSPLRR